MDPYDLGFGPKPMHIDRKSLYTSLEERIKYLHHFLDFNSDDVEALASGNKVLKQLIPAVVNLVYKKLLVYDITSRAFHTQTTADETEPEQDYLHEETPQIQRRKMFLRWYLIKLCQDPTSMDFWRYLNKVGIMHGGQERLHSLNIEFIHINVCIAYIQDIFIEALMSHPQLSLRRKIALIRAINKILMIQNDLFARHRIRDGEEFADEMSEYSFSTEGWVNGKKILGNSDGSSEDDGASFVSNVAPSTHSAAPSTQTSHTEHSLNTTNTSHTNRSASSVNAEASACPFADLAKNAGTSTKIWAN